MIKTLEEINALLETYSSSKITPTLIELIIAQIFQSGLFAELKFIDQKSFLDKREFKQKLIQAREIILIKLKKIDGENVTIMQKFFFVFKKKDINLEKSKEIYIKLANLITKILESDLLKSI